MTSDMVNGTARIERKVALAAAGKRLTVGELRQFVDALNEARVPDGVPVQVRTTMSGHLNKIEV